MPGTPFVWHCATGIVRIPHWAAGNRMPLP